MPRRSDPDHTTSLTLASEESGSVVAGSTAALAAKSEASTCAAC